MKKADEITIRRANVNDIEAIAELETACFSAPWPLEVIYEDLAIHKNLYYLVIKDDMAVGYAGMWMILDEAHINNVCIHPDYQGKGYGNRLVDFVIHEAYSQGADSLTLEVRAGNIRAQKLYARFGFIVEGIRKKYYEDNGEDALIIWKQGLSMELKKTNKN